MIPGLEALSAHHVATIQQPLPAGFGVRWVWAQNGIFKRGANATMEILLQVGTSDCVVPGLTSLLAGVRWSVWPRRIPAHWLDALLADARQAGTTRQPIEKQYFFVHRNGAARLIAPRNQVGTAANVHYAMPTDEHILVDAHSHHQLAGGAFFSGTDDRDDTGLSVSVVIGHIFSRPEILCRLNVYGHHQIVPAITLFDGLGPFVDKAGVYDADIDH